MTFYNYGEAHVWAHRWQVRSRTYFWLFGSPICSSVTQVPLLVVLPSLVRACVHSTAPHFRHFRRIGYPHPEPR